MIELAIFEATSKTLKAIVVCEKTELSDRLKEYRQKGRSVSLPEKLCKVELCKEFNWSCVRCIKNFYKSKNIKLDPSSLLKEQSE